MKPSVVQGVAELALNGWLTEKEVPHQGLVGGEEEPVAIWTAYELDDHLEACERVLELGWIADLCCACPEIEVRQRFVSVRVTTPGVGITDEDIDFARKVDFEIGHGQKLCGLTVN
ncbi:MAG: hypothetical protein GY719_28920 [bacterium]|nr:hypothetical protein [bacterium]